MSNELTTTTDLTENELIQVLGNSLYPGANPNSIKLVLGYCKAGGYDPIQKVCHIVPMWNSAIGKSVDTIMPGIGLYRIIAARTGQYAGISEPVYGPTIKQNIGGVECTFPEWCKITVKRNYGSFTSEFTSQEYWIENYAEKGGKERSIAPNSMWMKRPFGQIRKCTEAQALRMAFPEVGSQLTSDEMEGKQQEIVINPLPNEKPQASKLESILESIQSMQIEDFRKIDVTGLTKEETAQINTACKARKKQIIDSQVVATQEKQPETIEARIENCKTVEDYNNLIATLSPDEAEKHLDDIYFRMDMLRDSDAI